MSIMSVWPDYTPQRVYECMELKSDGRIQSSAALSSWV